MKSNVKRILVMIGVLLLLFATVSCQTVDPNNDPTDGTTPPVDNGGAQPPTDGATPPVDNGGAQLPTDGTQGESLGIFDLVLKNSYRETQNMTASIFPPYTHISSFYQLNITVTNGQIHVNDILYRATYTENLEWMLDRAHTAIDDRPETETVIAQLEKMHSCFLLETDESHYGKKIAVFEIDNTLYFVRLDTDDGIQWIHSVTVPNTGTDKSEQEPLVDVLCKNDGTATFRAEYYIQDVLSWVYSLDIQVKDGKIYINDVLYEEVTFFAPPTVLFGDGLLAYAAHLDQTNGNQEISDTLNKIKNADTCYVLKTNADSKSGKMIAVYKIDNAYYFVRFFDNGMVMRIHRAVMGTEM